MFDWCNTHQHSECPVKYQRFYIGPVGKGRQKRDGVIFLDDWRECDCSCHNPEQPKKVAKKTTRRKK